MVFPEPGRPTMRLIPSRGRPQPNTKSTLSAPEDIRLVIIPPPVGAEARFGPTGPQWSRRASNIRSASAKKRKHQPRVLHRGALGQRRPQPVHRSDRLYMHTVAVRGHP